LTGADNYMIKPIRHTELVARVQALLKRAYPIQNLRKQIVFNNYLFETRSGRLIPTGKTIEITQKEFEPALLFLATRDTSSRGPKFSRRHGCVTSTFHPAPWTHVYHDYGVSYNFCQKMATNSLLSIAMVID